MDAILRAKAEQLAGEMAEQVRTAGDFQALMRLMMKSVMERVLDVELDHHLGRRGPGLDEPRAAAAPTEESSSPAASKRRNRKNGHSKKTVRADLGELTIATPRDRNGTFEPLLIPKQQRQVSGFQEKILALYDKGMSTRDIQLILQELCGVEVSATLISDATAAIDAEVTGWRSRPLLPVRPFVSFDSLGTRRSTRSGEASWLKLWLGPSVLRRRHKGLR
jgi:transposase-like protein